MYFSIPILLYHAEDLLHQEKKEKNRKLYWLGTMCKKLPQLHSPNISDGHTTLEVAYSTLFTAPL